MQRVSTVYVSGLGTPMITYPLLGLGDEFKLSTGFNLFGISKMKYILANVIEAIGTGLSIKAVSNSHKCVYLRVDAPERLIRVCRWSTSIKDEIGVFEAIKRQAHTHGMYAKGLVGLIDWTRVSSADMELDIARLLPEESSIVVPAGSVAGAPMSPGPDLEFEREFGITPQNTRQVTGVEIAYLKTKDIIGGMFVKGPETYGVVVTEKHSFKTLAMLFAEVDQMDTALAKPFVVAMFAQIFVQLVVLKRYFKEFEHGGLAAEEIYLGDELHTANVLALVRNSVAVRVPLNATYHRLLKIGHFAGARVVFATGGLPQIIGSGGSDREKLARFFVDYLPNMAADADTVSLRTQLTNPSGPTLEELLFRHAFFAPLRDSENVRKYVDSTAPLKSLVIETIRLPAESTAIEQIKECLL